MWRAFSLAVAMICAPAHAQEPTRLTPLPDLTRALGDFDGDAQRDEAAFYETDEGALVVAVHFAARPNEPVIIWGGDISSIPYFSISTAAPGVHPVACWLYDACDSMPSSVTLTHEGITLHAHDGPGELLYYWDGAAFQNVMPRE